MAGTSLSEVRDILGYASTLKPSGILIWPRKTWRPQLGDYDVSYEIRH